MTHDQPTTTKRPCSVCGEPAVGYYCKPCRRARDEAITARVRAEWGPGAQPTTTKRPLLIPARRTGAHKAQSGGISDGWWAVIILAAVVIVGMVGVRACSNGDPCYALAGAEYSQCLDENGR